MSYVNNGTTFTMIFVGMFPVTISFGGMMFPGKQMSFTIPQWDSPTSRSSLLGAEPLAMAPAEKDPRNRLEIARMVMAKITICKDPPCFHVIAGEIYRFRLDHLQVRKLLVFGYMMEISESTSSISAVKC